MPIFGQDTADFEDQEGPFIMPRKMEKVSFILKDGINTVVLQIFTKDKFIFYLEYLPMEYTQ